ncbi:hypothetical protein AVEN_183941-1 [Araneus ventricosus]|uniref:Uncharacterized protein n=1 Tax=Araneus ventricosus TaxID=182803 RepID=A0A4Y2E0C9_ARAVE|nr:hypothetical protein AVEN_183941-1 [Araneus ventricosus]
MNRVSNCRDSLEGFLQHKYHDAMDPHLGEVVIIMHLLRLKYWAPLSRLQPFVTDQRYMLFSDMLYLSIPCKYIMDKNVSQDNVPLLKFIMVYRRIHLILEFCRSHRSP